MRAQTVNPDKVAIAIQCTAQPNDASDIVDDISLMQQRRQRSTSSQPQAMIDVDTPLNTPSSDLVRIMRRWNDNQSVDGPNAVPVARFATWFISPICAPICSQPAVVTLSCDVETWEDTILHPWSEWRKLAPVTESIWSETTVFDHGIRTLPDTLLFNKPVMMD